MKGGSFKEARLAICEKNQPTLSCPSSSTRSAESFCNEIVSFKERRLPSRRRPTADWRPPLLDSRRAPFYFRRVSICKPSDHWIEKIYGVVRSRRNREAHPDRCGNSSRAPPGDGRHN